jgi:hypothetical protein
MKLFDKKGMMLFPNPMKRSEICESENLLVINECYCPNGHNLISEQAIFNGFQGIIIKVSRNKQSGLVALSPVYGYKSRVSLDLPIHKDEIWEAYCPECNEKLPYFSDCSCHGKLFALFLDQSAEFSNSILICNRIDCFNAQIKYNNEIVHYPGVDVFI